MTEFDDNWITTHTGKKFHYLDPQPDEIDIVDIAHHLSYLCRFTGAVSGFYSVADHSIRVAELLPPELRLAGLLHDAAEAYINDLSRPVKYTHKLQETEARIGAVIAKKFGVDFSDPRIKEADNILIATEARDLMPNMDGWAELPTPLPTKITPSPPFRIVKAAFLYRFRSYSNG
uniref:HD domain-containing protein n=1 Tax=viral metagenome TaxID=1070528 RepID=A0A6M3IJF1_9ZZZZ